MKKELKYKFTIKVLEYQRYLVDLDILHLKPTARNFDTISQRKYDQKEELSVVIEKLRHSK